MKPKVLHVIGDKRAGGSNHLVRHLIQSPLGEEFAFSMLRLEEVKGQIKQIQPDVIIFHYPCAWKYLRDLLWLKRYAPVFIYDHHYCEGFEVHQVPSRFRFRQMIRLAYAIADGVLSVSQAQARWMTENGLVKASKIQVISPATPVEGLLQLPPKELGEPLVLGAYGRFAKQKGFDLLLQAIAQLPPEKFQLQLGGYGPDEEQIQHLAASLPQVQLKGSIQDVPAFLQACDVVVIPSRWEPWGLVCLEAKAAAKPVVVTAVDGLTEQVTACGLSVPAGDATQLAEAIASLPQQDLNSWGEKGRANVTQAWQDFLNHWQDFLTVAIAADKP